MEFKNQTSFYKGKVREVHGIGKDKLVMIASDRISAFDHILPKPIPFKGAILNQIATHFLESTRHIVPNWLMNAPLPNVSVGHKCEPIPIEMVIRGYLTGHAARTYKKGLRTLCGVTLPEGLKEHDAFEQAIITPATKADEGHDEDISREEILERGIVSQNIYEKMEAYSRALFAEGTKHANDHGLILVDTKYEFGLYNGELMLMDEIHTPDSSRYFYAEGYEERQSKGEEQKQLSKEFVREWLIENDFQGLEGQTMPVMPDEFVSKITDRYQELYEKLLGKKFERRAVSNDQIVETVNAWIEKNN